MSDALPPDGAPPDQSRLDAVECPFCGGVTMPNLLADGSYICSCPAERALPLGEGTPVVMPPPVDDGSFVSPVHAKPNGLPGNKGQFGRDVQTDDYKLLGDPPGSTDPN